MNLNFRLRDYTPATTEPDGPNGCGVYTDNGTFSIIFQDGTVSLEVKSPSAPGTWLFVLCGWCTLILTGGTVYAARHRTCTLKPIGSAEKQFSSEIMNGKVAVEWFKKFMGKRRRRTEGNEELDKRIRR
ncbi:hypothetical protein D8B26_000559 [Coccidioides posadasii str. Silveira]|uniref:Predicted protein n=1 Tax=Coccidioides posadasii (strain RMSCC 757 / Silveira) TaxID=443226 RepID=E9DFB9_COCPS|nr:predicted protein [Coccidioides posadasii str. Silveira]QVM05851.1 hypothetical protein D8B26_000559 [Coccidioides posadasii str. Silveira]